MGRKPDEITYSSELVPVNNASANGIHHESCLPPAIMPLFVATAAKPAKYEAYDMMAYSLQHAACSIHPPNACVGIPFRDKIFQRSLNQTEHACMHS